MNETLHRGDLMNNALKQEGGWMQCCVETQIARKFDHLSPILVTGWTHRQLVITS